MNKYIKDLPKALFISFAIFLVLMVLNVISGYQLKLDYELWSRFLYTMLYGVCLYYANGFVFDYVDSFFKVNRFPPRRLIIGSLASFVVSIEIFEPTC